MLPYINIPFAYAAGLTGASVDELKLIASFLLSYPLAGILKRIPDTKPYQKNIFIVGVSLFYLIGLFDLWAGIRTLFISSAGAYCIAKYIDGSLMPWIAFVFLMGHMSINHIDRQFTNDPSAIDISGAQMVLIMKLTAFCWNVHDGRLKPAEMTTFQKERAIYELPSLLDYAGYVLFFPSLFAGPAFDFIEYRNWIDTTMFVLPPGTDPARAPRTRKKRKIPRSGTPATLKAITGLFWILLFLNFSSWYTPQLLLGDDYMKYGFLRRVWLLHMVGFSTRLKYYGVWYLTEGACILSGLGYNGIDPKTGRVLWNRLQNVNPIAIETAQNAHAYLGNWNMNTNHWLRYYMYLRVTPKGRKPGFRASMATFVTSAFWHGFYPGYYMTFMLASFIQTGSKNFRRYIRPFFLNPTTGAGTPKKRYYDIITFFVTQAAFSFTVAPFILLSFSGSLLVWARVYFYTIIGVIAAIIFFSGPLGMKHRLTKELEKRTKRKVAAGELKRTASTDDFGNLGVPNDLERDVDEAMAELKQEIELRRRRGSVVQMPTGQDLKRAVEDKLGRKF
ncbi:MAG: lysophospholipid acyltransferase [Cirrosporium novae-zelandiae]|nr:MAG: lysophospholipid acyltransferase [Cirrosporium novae-zelandiae]